jgi:ABC-type transporter Mla subunit MlaD
MVSEKISQSITETIKKLQVQLTQFDRHAELLNKYAQGLETTSEIGTALVDMFEAIINFWTLAILLLQDAAAG